MSKGTDGAKAPIADDVCPDHPDVEPEMGFGLAGGGYGPYLYCPQCGRVFNKTQELDEGGPTGSPDRGVAPDISEGGEK